MTASSRCLSCGAGAVRMLLDFGPQPPSNRFERTDVPNRETHALVLGQCAGCGLLQLVNPMAPAMVKSRFEWLTYNEPEGHLDDLVGRLRNLPGIGRESHIVGVTYKDDTTLARFNRLGYANTRRFAAAADLDLTDPRAGLESIQSALDQARARRLAALHGRADLLVVRHVLEHAHRPAEFLRALLELVKSGGYLVFEMPDSTTFVKACDYSFVWEEHIAYFSRDTLEAFFGSAGAAVHAVHLYPYPLEDSLIAVVRNASSANSARSSQAELEATLGSGRVFARRYPELKAGVREVIRRWRGEGKKVAVFGAGHLAAKFINLFSVADLIECVIDDNPHKQALLMPGSRLPIRGSAELASGPIDVCLLSLNPESEQKVRAKNQAFLERGGRFASIFAVSPQAVQRLTPA